MTGQTSEKTCCSPTRTENMRVIGEQAVKQKKTSKDFTSAKVPGGIALLGTNRPQITDDGEDPL
ncbi:MAG: hypothetical protein OXF46_06735, partial [Rhodobacteraceae bacterium]|nr:hypothetical protein [Paracoccaceae bacterium]